ncbi:4-diphosphocytidyl-2C-methyl-D-erythritol kinase [Thiobacillus denitrificans ATCC 25259]|uniref:4-diphosphocytidyl-2-C-methyl-D-erythritol kinase n=1 Tax=Thiobacillus denitrificans (strain ATCC 25259 / T1) TaxID=292415 RepID=ISPE_THIDA|nr:4-(cytidine 5'-diphospho)-2-C-methyl-D-erythritol kinase [Thiobacillus denitrificans]Q3SLR6.1 RecName: Full=4-diphosphocytidyl-2-C-methyl-D-erythritol kinase; Short=CMK; AltName: Full=4-(cytidine-5'-diphospho)-2-C-methyl-D-erythritol kinase [Thiobacillus denitrificans ATCC 25259]AAZ96339.1 4-diphosphocytidyl-2C-methyl-D-erythritol kinase [Thiobacillus denitrificans ATCC 25259]
MSQAFPAPAKLNLFLHVVGRRDDGYHLLQSVFRLIDRADTVHLELRDDGRIVREGALPGVSEDQDLTVRAARLLQPYARPGAGVGIRLDKRLPMGGGLGGGSSDAATVLLALNRLWEVDLPRQRLQALALRLGADVPVFVFGQTAFAEGVGELLQPIGAPVAWYVVLTPPVHVPTAAIFAAPELTRNTPALKIAPFSAGMGHNDLEPVVVGRYPEVGRHLQWLGQFGEARMTGSGACVFASFATEDAARSVLQALPDTMQGFVARGLDKHPLYDFVPE